MNQNVTVVHLINLFMITCNSQPLHLPCPNLNLRRHKARILRRAVSWMEGMLHSHKLLLPNYASIDSRKFGEYGIIYYIRLWISISRVDDLSL